MTKRGVGIALFIVISILFLIGASLGLGKNGQDVQAVHLPTGKIVFVSTDFIDDPENHKWDSIQEGINDAEEGDIVLVFEGTYAENIFINKNIEILGKGNVTINGGGALYTVTILSDGVRLTNLIVVNGDIAGLFIGGFSDITIEVCDFRSSSNYGALLLEVSNTIFKNCSFTTNAEGGLFISNSSFVYLLDSLVMDSLWGIIIENSSYCYAENISISEIENKGVSLRESFNVDINDCVTTDCFCGIRLRNSINISIAKCLLINNIIGIRLDASSSNTIINCDFDKNAGYGVSISEFDGVPSNNNTFCRNFFFDNNINAYDNCVNFWNHSIGNYWDDYVGIDANGDGIGDTPHTIWGGDNHDYKPTMSPSFFPSPHSVWIDDDFTPFTPGWGYDHFTKIQDGVDTVSTNGTVYIFSGTYYETVEIEKSLTLKGEGNVSLFSATDGILIHAGNVNISGIVIESDNTGIKIVNSHNVSVENCTSHGAIFGLYILNSVECSISHSRLFDNVKGIYLSNANRTNMKALNIHNNSYFGIEIAHHSTENMLFDSYIEYNEKFGIYIFQNSNDNKIWHNNFINNTAYDVCTNEWGSDRNLSIGNYWSDYTGTDSNDDGLGDSFYILEGGGKEDYPLINKITHPPTFVWVSHLFNISIPGWKVDHFNSIAEAIGTLKKGGGCFVFSGIYQENIIVEKRMIITGENTTMVEGQAGSAFIISAENVTIQNMGIKNCWNDAGITILANTSRIYGCRILNNYYGIFIDAINTTVEKTEINENSFIGIWVFSSEKTTIRNCTVKGNNDGIVFEHTNYGSVEECNISSNSFTGVRMEFSLGNVFHSCDIGKNIYGISSKNSFGNTIFFNNFLENWKHSLDNGQNPYDNGTIGNYWDDYSGTDGNNDGIGDEPYYIEGNGNIDNYPLVRKKGLPVAYLSYQPSDNISTRDSILFFDESVDVDGFITSWLWDFGDGNISNNENPAHRYGDNGTYAVNLSIVDNDGNTAITTATLEVANTLPAANFSWIPSFPNDNETISFLDMSVDVDGFITSWLWDFGDGNVSEEQSPAHVYKDNGNYSVTLIITDDDDAINTTQKVITVSNIPPLGNFSWSPNNPFTSNTIHFIDHSADIDGNIVNWTWNFNDGNISFEQNPSHDYADDGTYPVILIVKDNDNATSVITKNITVTNSLPHVDFTFYPTFPKDVQTVTFTDNTSDSDGNIISWFWEFGDGDTSTKKNPTHIYSDDGAYIINLTVIDDDNATNTTSKSISVKNDPPSSSFYYTPPSPTDLDIVSFIDVSGDADGNVVSWNWDFGDGNTSSSQNPMHHYYRDGAYTVKLKVTDDDGDSDTSSLSIIIANAPPVVNFSFSPLSPTDLQKITFKDNSTDEDGTIVNWTWSFGDGNISYGIEVTHKYRDDGNYSVVCTVTDDEGATSSLTKHIQVKNVKPTASFIYEPEKPREKQTVTFSDSSIDKDGSVVNWSWDFGDGTTGNGVAKVITHVYEEKGEYIVSLTVLDDDGSNATEQKLIEIREKEEASGFDIVVLIAALSVMLIFWRKRIGIWHKRH